MHEVTAERADTGRGGEVDVLMSGAGHNGLTVGRYRGLILGGRHDLDERHPSFMPVNPNGPWEKVREEIGDKCSTTAPLTTTDSTRWTSDEKYWAGRTSRSG
jgi:hypothetical protein